MSAIGEGVLVYLRALHGLFNLIVMFLFMYQGSLGLGIRKERREGRAVSPALVMKHRRFGRVVALLGVAGFLAGLTLAYLDHGNIFKYPLHLAFGAATVAAIASAFLLSRMIRGAESPWRKRHMAAGFAILCLYPVQVYLGLAILIM